MEVVDDTTGREAERVVVVGKLLGGLVVALLEDGATVGTKCFVLGRADDGTGEEVVTIGFDVVAKSNRRVQLRGMEQGGEKDVQIRRELAVSVETLFSVGVLLVARPLDARTASKLCMKSMSKKETERKKRERTLVAQTGVIARTTLRRLRPMVERRFRIVEPGDEVAAVLVLEAHSSSILAA